jgi:hypothetical protein
MKPRKEAIIRPGYISRISVPKIIMKTFHCLSSINRTQEIQVVAEGGDIRGHERGAVALISPLKGDGD